MDINKDDQYSVLSIVAGVLHMGNIDFVEHGNYASVQDPQQCAFIYIYFLNLKCYFIIHHRRITLFYSVLLYT